MKQLPVLLGCVAMTAYFASHALYGRHGLETRNRLIERSRVLDLEIRSLETVRSRLSRDIALLSSDPPDSDLVDEIARDVLGFALPKDRIVLSDGTTGATPRPR